MIIDRNKQQLPFDTFSLSLLDCFNASMNKIGRKQGGREERRRKKRTSRCEKSFSIEYDKLSLEQVFRYLTERFLYDLFSRCIISHVTVNKKKNNGGNRIFNQGEANDLVIYLR